MLDNIAKAALTVGGKVARLTDRASTLSTAPAPPSAIQDRMEGGEHRLGMGQFLPIGDSAQVRRRIVDFLAGTELITLYTVGEAGWPMAHCMHFAAVAGAEGQLTAYLFTQKRTRKLANIRQDPRVALTAFRPEVTGDPRQASRLELRGLCSELSDPEERYFAMLCQFHKPGYEFARLLGLDKQPALRIDIVAAVWEDRANGLPAVTIDYVPNAAG